MKFIEKLQERKDEARVHQIGDKEFKIISGARLTVAMTAYTTTQIGKLRTEHKIDLGSGEKATQALLTEHLMNDGEIADKLRYDFLRAILKTDVPMEEDTLRLEIEKDIEGTGYSLEDFCLEFLIEIQSDLQKTVSPTTVKVKK